LNAINNPAQNLNWVRHDSLIKVGMNQIYRANFERAEKTFSIVEKEFSKHPSGKFFKALIIWWQILIDPNLNILDGLLFKRIDEVIKLCDDILIKNSNNYDGFLFKASAYGLQAELFALRKNWVNALYAGDKALGFAVVCYEKRPKDIDLQFIFGFYHYIADFIFDKYPVLKPLSPFLPNGNKIRGLNELENAALNGRYARIEARFFLQIINYHYEKNYSESLKWGEYLINEFPDNPYFTKYFLSALNGKTN